MKRIKYSIRALLLVATLFVSLVVSPGVASAASDYDDVISHVDSVHLSRSGVQGTPTCASLDITSSWTSILVNSSSWTSRTQVIGGATRDATLADWAAARTGGGGWAVVQQHNNNVSYPDSGSPIGDAVYVVFTPSASAQIAFSSNSIYWGPQKQAYLTNTDDGYVYSLRIQFDDLGAGGGDDKCTPVVSMALREVSSTPSYWENESVAATSTESMGGYSLRPLFVNAAISYPGYGGEIPATSAPPAKYAALGDSFSSGEGNPLFEAGTDENGVDKCHRSSRAYPRLIQNELDLGQIAFVACSGATTNDVLGIPEGDDPIGKGIEPTQVDSLSEATSTVTITIGGNDVGFGDFAYECLFPINLTHGTCDEFTDIYTTTVGKINNELPDKLKNLYTVLLNKAENANIYVLGYPQIAPYKTVDDPFDQDCGGLYDEFPNNWGDARAAHEVTGLLNDTIEGVVDAVKVQHQTNRLVFVPVSNGAFVGHDACSSNSFFNGIVISNPEYSVHPNADGQIAYKDDLKSVMN
ncbi:MAG TPA: SGNH/GDSL hydrolase family protein [Candidatus Saccharimonadales bacterium]|nr:SGNH/GDSL hydrolase family protein [Candidatus Saccharimonadales bacterium]